MASAASAAASGRSAGDPRPIRAVHQVEGSGAQEAAFVRFLEAGGGWLGTHAAGDSSHEDWRWYTETLIGSEITDDARLANVALAARPLSSWDPDDRAALLAATDADEEGGDTPC